MLCLGIASLDATRQVAARIAGVARPGDIIILAGEMGAGKTAFAQGFGSALGIADPITSPTFTLVHSYPIDQYRTLHHADIYRLDSMADIEELALHELAEFGGIVLVEWGDAAPRAFREVLEIRLQHDYTSGDFAADDEFGLDARRQMTVSATGQRWASRWGRLGELLEPFVDNA